MSEWPNFCHVPPGRYAGKVVRNLVSASRWFWWGVIKFRMHAWPIVRRSCEALREHYNAKELVRANARAREAARMGQHLAVSSFDSDGEAVTSSCLGENLRHTFPWLGGFLTCRKQLGAGTYGTVFEAGFEVGTAVVAVKVHSPDSDVQDLAAEHAFLDRLRHPFILATFGFCASSTVPWFWSLAGGI